MITIDIEGFYALGYPVPTTIEDKTLWRVYGEVDDEAIGEARAYLGKDQLLYAALGSSMTGKEEIDNDFDGFFEDEHEAWEARHEFYMKHGRFDPDYFGR
jgi:hypothetical protein